jgi:hypothetical protein
MPFPMKLRPVCANNNTCRCKWKKKLTCDPHDLIALLSVIQINNMQVSKTKFSKGEMGKVKHVQEACCMLLLFFFAFLP